MIPTNLRPISTNNILREVCDFFRHNCGKSVELKKAHPVSKSCGILHLIRDCLDESSLIFQYFALVYPALIYCQTKWGAASTTALQPLNIVQNCVIRAISRIRCSYSFHNIISLVPILDVTEPKFIIIYSWQSDVNHPASFKSSLKNLYRCIISVNNYSQFV